MSSTEAPENAALSDWSGCLKDERVEVLLQKLEKTCKKVLCDKSLSVMSADPASAEYMPLRVREIVSHCLLSSPAQAGVRGEAHDGQVERREGGGRVGEGRRERETRRLRELLAEMQKENEELHLKHIAASERIEGMSRLQEEVSSLTLQAAHLREENTRLHETLLDQETSFSYALRSSQSEKRELEQKIAHMEIQVQKYMSHCHDLEQQLSDRDTASEEEKNQLILTVRQLEERVVCVRREGEEAERVYQQELRQAIERAEVEEQRAQELLVVNQQFQQQVAEVQLERARLLDNVHQLSLTLSQTQARLFEQDAQRDESFMVVQEQSAQSKQLSLTMVLRDVSSYHRELNLLRQAVSSDITSARSSLTHVFEDMRALVRHNTLYLEQKRQKLQDTMLQKEEENQRLQQLLSDVRSEQADQKASHLTQVAELQASLDHVQHALSQIKEEKHQLQFERQQQLQTLRHEVQQLEKAMTSERDQLSISQEQSKKLHAQLSNALLEADNLRCQLTVLKSHHQKAVEDHSCAVKQLVALENEKIKLQKELLKKQRKVIKLEEEIVEEKEKNKNIQESLRGREGEIDAATNRVEELEELNKSKMKKMKSMKSLISQLEQKVVELTSILEEKEEHLMRTKSEVNQIKKESYNLSESLSKFKQALNEAQVQRAQMNCAITKLAQEKGDLLREKVSLRVQIGSLEDALKYLKKKEEIVGEEQRSLDQKLKEVEKRLMLEVLSQSSVKQLKSANSLEIYSLDVPYEAEGLQQVERKTEGDISLRDELAQVRRKEQDLHLELESQCLQYDADLRKVNEAHDNAMSVLRRQHQAALESWRTENDALRSITHSQKEQQSKMFALLQEKDSTIDMLRRTANATKSEYEKLQREMIALQKAVEALNFRPTMPDSASLPKQPHTAVAEWRTHISADDDSKLSDLHTCLERIHQLDEDASSMRKRNKHLQHASEEIKTALVKAEDENLGLKKVLAVQIEDIEQYKEQISDLKKVGDEKERDVKAKDKEKQEQTTSFCAQLADMQDQYNTLQQEVLLYQSQMEKASSSLVVLKAENSSLLSKLETSEARCHDIEEKQKQMLKLTETIFKEYVCRSSNDSDALVRAVESSHTPLSGNVYVEDKSCPQTSSWTVQTAIKSLMKMQTEMCLSKQLIQKLDQSSQDLQHAQEEKAMLEARVQTLRSSLTSLQTGFDVVSQERHRADSVAKKLKKSTSELQAKIKDLQENIRTLQQELQSAVEGHNRVAMQKWVETKRKNCELEVLRSENSTCVKQLSQLKSEINQLQATLLAKDNQLMLQEAKLESTSKNISFQTAQFEARMKELEGHSKQELERQVHTKLEEYEILKKKTSTFRDENTRLQKEMLAQRKEIEKLSECLKTTTVEKQQLSESLEREIDRLRSEVKKHMKESCSLKLQLVQGGDQSFAEASVTEQLETSLKKSIVARLKGDMYSS